MTSFKRYGRWRGRSAGRPSRTWASIDALASGWDITGTATTSANLISLQAPTSLASLTSDPPEDMTLLRIVGDFQVTVSTTGIWVMALLVQDTVWTPSATFNLDADKRVLWSRSYQAVEAVLHTYCHDGHCTVTGTNMFECRDLTHIDIKPMVKLEPGKSLVLVAYEQSGSATFTSNSQNMRVLFQRTQRKR